MNNKKEKLKGSTAPFPAPLLIFPGLGEQIFRSTIPTQAQSFEFYTVSDGYKKVFTDKDALSDYGFQSILDPLDVSYINLFINGVLQPKINYSVKKGILTLNTDDQPLKGAPIILQMIKI